MDFGIHRVPTNTRCQRANAHASPSPRSSRIFIGPPSQISQSLPYQNRSFHQTAGVPPRGVARIELRSSRSSARFDTAGRFGRGIRRGDLCARAEAIEGSSHERGVRGLRAPVLRGIRLPLPQVHRRLRSRWRYVPTFSLLLVSSNTVRSNAEKKKQRLWEIQFGVQEAESLVNTRPILFMGILWLYVYAILLPYFLPLRN